MKQAVRRVFALLLALLLLASAALADGWRGTAAELAERLTAASYTLPRLKAESDAKVVFEGGAIEVFASEGEAEAAFAEAETAFLADNVLLTREPSKITSHYEAALAAILSGLPIPDWNAAEVRREQILETKVWIPLHGGVKYHAKATCSGMKGPDEVTVREAIAQGFEACKRCKPVVPE